MLAPVLVVFTKYDLLVFAKQCDEDPDIDEETLQTKSQVDANKDFQTACVDSLERLTVELGIPKLSYITVSGTRSWFPCCSALTCLSPPWL